VHIIISVSSQVPVCLGLEIQEIQMK